MELTPTELKRLDDQTLLITWSDGQRKRYAVSDLRKSCPCVMCRNERKAAEHAPQQLTILAPTELAPLKIDRMALAGNYAYRITFSDGHNTGLFTFEHLRQLGEVVE